MFSKFPIFPSAQPIFNTSPVVLRLCFFFLLFHVLSWIAPGFYYNHLFPSLSFKPSQFHGFSDVLYLFPSFPGYMFLHADFAHFLANTGMLLAFGTPLARLVCGRHFFAIFLLSGFTGAAVYWIFGPSNITLIGASAGTSGVLGAVCGYFFWYRKGMMPPPRFFDTRRNVLIFTLVWLSINLIFIIDSFKIAWQAHYAGFFTGALMVGFFTRLVPRENDFNL